MGNAAPANRIIQHASVMSSWTQNPIIDPRLLQIKKKRSLRHSKRLAMTHSANMNKQLLLEMVVVTMMETGKTWMRTMMTMMMKSLWKKRNEKAELWAQNNFQFNLKLT